MIVEEMDSEHFEEYTNEINNTLQKDVKLINEIFDDLYIGRALFRYNIDEGVIKNILKKQYNIDGE